MDNNEIVASIKKTWTEKMQKKETGLTESILNGYAKWVQSLVKQVTEQQAIKAKQPQSSQGEQPMQQSQSSIQPQGGVA